MAKDNLYDPPLVCPVTGEKLIISELTAEKSGIAVRGRFRMPMGAHLDEEQKYLLEVFLRSRGVISTMERELGLSYPTVKARVDSLLEAMNLEPFKHEKKDSSMVDVKRKILKQLEEGKITAAEAKERLKGGAK